MLGSLLVALSGGIIARLLGLVLQSIEASLSTVHGLADDSHNNVSVKAYRVPRGASELLAVSLLASLEAPAVAPRGES